MNRHSKTGLIVIVAALAISVASCTRETAPTVEYYRANPAERQTQLRECTDSPGTSREKPACVNAREAERVESVGSLRNLPPLGLSTQKPQDSAESSSQQNQANSQ